MPRPRRKLSALQATCISAIWFVIAGWLFSSVRLDIFSILAIILSGIIVFIALYKSCR
nr:hypothetical protein [uncultured Porphyromonas sp.]